MPSEVFGRHLTLMAQALQQAASIVLSQDLEVNINEGIVLCDITMYCCVSLSVANDAFLSRSSEYQHSVLTRVTSHHPLT